jgi:S-adenosylmethionine:tRNA ribosyltransferase-isomerase
MSPLLHDAGLDFVIPAEAEATGPAERRGLSRDGVRMLVARGIDVGHQVVADLPGVLAPGDLVVVNTSETLPAALDAARGDGRIQPLHVATELDDGRWVVELRRVDNSGPDLAVRPGTRLSLPGGIRLTIAAAYPDPTAATSRLWTARPAPATRSATQLAQHGRPIRYGYVAEPWPLADYQTVFATYPGSAEMPSAGRPFTDRLVVRLVAAGVAVVPVTLHCGVSSPEAHEPPAAERFDVPDATARLVNTVREAGGRIVAIGTTVVRALESVADTSGVTRAGAGWTDLVLGPDRPARVVTGLLTGLHEPGASHLELLEAVAGTEAVRTAYAAAVDEGYLWHEFGDTTLFLA